jgi:hypothetical protein
MSALPQKLLSAALRVKWETGHSQDQRAVKLLAERVPGFTAEQYAEASRRAAAWFATRGQGPYPTVGALEARCPGFSGTDYAEAVGNNVTWARK